MTERSSTVRAWEEEISLPTYAASPADPNPMFLEKRVYQGSSGKVYPNPFTERISTAKRAQAYRAIYLENEYVRLMMLPEIGGRIHVGLDKTTGYDFFYRQNVIKPALVGLLGPWISGGVEFNWPQHHRPSTFMPVHASIEHGADGSATVWLSEHDPMLRMKGMVGICLRPGSSLIEAKVRLYNRTPLLQTFLWWANVAVRVDENYEAFFPSDVHFVADHAKRAVSRFPIAKDFYYGVDYTSGVDLRWYKNIPVPTSYMVTKSKYDFFGGYDHAREAGFVHFADRHISPGKKLWTWGSGEFGQAWDRNLTDQDGPYIELMAGVYTDNQPDFSWLAPYETKTFSQFWYPIQKIGPVSQANDRLALSVASKEDGARVGLCSTKHLPKCSVEAWRGQERIFIGQADLAPGTPWFGEVRGNTDRGEFRLEVRGARGELLLKYQPERPQETELPAPATEPPPASEIASNDELYITGLHLEQYRHATRSPESYWEEGLRRDPSDARINNAMGLMALRRGEFSRAESFFRSAIYRLTLRNPNPRDGESYYNLGLALRWQHKCRGSDDVYEAFYKATWNYAWRSAGHFALAGIASTQGDFRRALLHLEDSLRSDPESSNAQVLKAALLRHLGRKEEASMLLTDVLHHDPEDFFAMAERALADLPSRETARNAIGRLGSDVQTALDIAYDYSDAGLWDDASQWLELVVEETGTEYPMVFYTLGWLSEQGNSSSLAWKYWQRAASAPSLYCFPSRLEEMLVLQRAAARDPHDAKAHYYLGNFYYDRKRYEDAIACWQTSIREDPNFSIPWRNLGIAQYNVRHDSEAALTAYRRAREVNPADARVFYEYDQLRKRMAMEPAERLAEFEACSDLVDQRDDLTVEYLALLNLSGRHEQAVKVLTSRRFNPWEGGEGLVSGQWVQAHTALGRGAIEAGDFSGAVQHFRAARHYPENLGEGKHLLTLERPLDYWEAFALEQTNDMKGAQELYQAGAQPLPEPSEHSYYRALSLRKLGSADEADSELEKLKSYALKLRDQEPRIPYFAASLPNFLLFEDDLKKRNLLKSLVLEAYAVLGLGDPAGAAALFEKAAELDPSNYQAQEELAFLKAAAPTREESRV